MSAFRVEGARRVETIISVWNFEPAKTPLTIEILWQNSANKIELRLLVLWPVSVGNLFLLVVFIVVGDRLLLLLVRQLDARIVVVLVLD